MIVDIVPWISHSDGPIFSLDVHPSGEKLATCGQDNKIRIWNLLPALHARHEEDPAVPRLLATLENHLGAVNVVRFSKNGQYLASGADDQLVCISKLHAGQGKVAFGSNSAPSLENWRQVQALRGHDNNVVDLSWSPDSQYVASASLDNLVIIWEAATGRRVSVLKGHQGFVKGVAWDPFNAFVATQGENDGVFIWRVSDWSLLKTIKKPLGDSCGVAFHTRLGWSPDGQILAAVNSIDGPKHIVPLIRRNTWDSEHSYVGHNAAVVVARYNPRFFYPRKDGNSDEACTVAALGSSDKQFSVWSPKENLPICVGSKIFKGGVMDAAWTPDGYSLLLASYDGKVAALRFEVKELGRVVPDKEVQELISALYGDPSVRRGSTLAESVEVLMLEREAAAADGGVGLAAGGGRVASAAAGANKSSANIPLPPQLAGAAPPGIMSKLSNRLGSGGVGLGSSSAAEAMPAPAPVTSTAAGIKRRLQLTAADGPASVSAASGGLQQVAQTGVGGKPAGQPAAKRAAVAAAAAPKPVAAVPAAAAAVTPPPAPRTGGSKGPAPRAAAAGMDAGDASVLIQPPPITQKVSIRLGRRQSSLFGGQEGAGTLSLDACNNAGRDHQGKMYAELACSCSGRPLWQDRIEGGGAVTQMAGTLLFSAASTSQGDLQVYSAAGRRLFPAIQLGCRTAFMHASATQAGNHHAAKQSGRCTDWLLLVVTTDGELKMWDLQKPTCVLETSVAPLLTQPGVEVTKVRFSSSGCPLVVLSNCNAHAYHTEMKCWMRVADGSLPTSGHHTLFVSAAAGDLAHLQQAASSQLQAEDVLGAALSTTSEWQVQQGRAHLEINMASAQALGSPAEWKRWLITYVRQLAADADEVRLREVVEELLGPIRWSPLTHPPGAGGWQPTIMGMEKRQILRNEVLKEVARNRSNQTLLREVMDMLNDVERVQRHPDEAQH